MVASVLLPVQPKKIGMRGVFTFAVSTTICFFSSGESIDVSPVEPMISTAEVPCSSWNFSKVWNAPKSTEPSLLNGVMSATNEPVSIFLDIAVSMPLLPSLTTGSMAGQPAITEPFRRSLYDRVLPAPTRLPPKLSRLLPTRKTGHAVALRRETMRLLRVLIAVAVSGARVSCGQGPHGPKGDPGLSGSGIRIIRANCDPAHCSVQCGEDELLLTAYCGARRNAAIIPTERSATCRSPVPANSPLVAACVRAPPP